MCLCVRERQGAAPGAAEYEPATDAQMRAQLLEVRKQVRRSIVRQFAVRDGAARAALIEQDDTIERRIEEAPLAWAAARTWPAV